VALGLLVVVAGVSGLAEWFGGAVVALGAGGTALVAGGGYALYRRAKNGKRRSVTRRISWKRSRTTGGGRRRQLGGKGFGGGRGFRPFKRRGGGSSGGGGSRGGKGLGKLFKRRGAGSGASAPGGGRRGRLGKLGGAFKRRGGGGSGSRSGGSGSRGRLGRFRSHFPGGRRSGSQRSGSGRGGGLRGRMASRMRRGSARRAGWSAPYGRGQGGRPLTRKGRPASRLRRGWWALTPNAAWRKPKTERKAGAKATSRPQRLRQAMRRLVPAGIRRRQDRRRALKQTGATRPGPVRRALTRMVPAGLRRKLWRRKQNRNRKTIGGNPLAPPTPWWRAAVARLWRPRWLARRNARRRAAQQPEAPQPAPAVPQPNFRPASGQQLPGPGIAAGGPKFVQPTAPQSRGGSMANPAEAISEAAAALRNWKPSSGEEFAAFLKQWPEAIEDLSSNAASAAAVWHEEHIHPNVITTFEEGAHALHGMADTAAEAFDSHLKEHALWVE
jgi:23S rRNA pseudouridine2605 synthase